MRTFIAIELPEPIKAALGALSQRLRAGGAQAAWVRPENIHLTLRFLGDVDDARLATLSGMLRTAYKDVAPFPVNVCGTGVFPNARRPSVIWVGMSPVEGGLGEVQAAAETAACAIGLPPEERGFQPHLTLARIRDSRKAQGLMELLRGEEDFAAGAFDVAGVTLFSSQLAPGGSIYRQLEVFRFD
jgi:2'-5' RNA ligase